MFCRSTVTTTVFCILLLVTIPTFSCRLFCITPYSHPVRGRRRTVREPPLRSSSLQLALAQNCLRFGNTSAQLAKRLQALRLPACHAKPQAAQLAGKLALPRREFVVRPFAHILRRPLPLLVLFQLHDVSSAGRYAAALRETNCVAKASLCPARRSASRASSSETPSISNRIRPGFTTATQNSGAPLPFPIRVSAGFLVTGLSGKMRIQSFPPLLMKRMMATRLASIWRSVIHPGSRTFNPKSPKDMSDPRQAFPHMRPRCCFRYLTLLGINICSFSVLYFQLAVAVGKPASGLATGAFSGVTGAAATG